MDRFLLPFHLPNDFASSGRYPTFDYFRLVATVTVFSEANVKHRSNSLSLSLSSLSHLVQQYNTIINRIAFNPLVGTSWNTSKPAC